MSQKSHRFLTHDQVIDISMLMKENSDAYSNLTVDEMIHRLSQCGHPGVSPSSVRSIAGKLNIPIKRKVRKSNSPRRQMYSDKIVRLSAAILDLMERVGYDNEDHIAEVKSIAHRKASPSADG